MISAGEAGWVLTEMVAASANRDRPRTAVILQRLLAGQRGDVLMVVGAMALTVAEGSRPDPELGFHRLRVHVVQEDGTVAEGSASDLPPHVAVFSQMAAAYANADMEMAKDLFIGYVGDDGRRALLVLTYGLAQTVHKLGLCPDCQQGAAS